MRFKQFGSTYIVRLQRGEEIVSSLKQLCLDEDIQLGAVAGIGAAERIELGYYDVVSQEYSSKSFKEQHEITALQGNITRVDNEPYLHLHITIGDSRFHAYAGHLAAATVSGTCEIIITAVKGAVGRFKDEKETGLNLLDI